MYNPKLKDFLEANKDITLIGSFWAGYWRFMVIVLGISIVFAFLAEL